ncbi:hypothetical protein HID58_080849, partial [Brassica napus]
VKSIYSKSLCSGERRRRDASTCAESSSESLKKPGHQSLCIFNSTGQRHWSANSSISSSFNGRRRGHTRIRIEEYIGRRKKLAELLPQNSLAIVSSAPMKMMTDVVPYTFRQEADYLYLTGCQPTGWRGCFKQ